MNRKQPHTAVLAIVMGLRYTNLRLVLKELKTQPDIMEEISSSINVWRLQANPPSMLTQVGQHQMNLSWNNFMHGFVHQSWRMTQTQYYKQCNINKSHFS